MSLNPNEEFGDRDASKIDEAISKSIIPSYVSGKLKTIAGHFDMALPDQFEFWFKNWKRSDENVDEVPGFVNRGDKNKPIKLRLPGKNKTPATFETAVHETVHYNSNEMFANNFGPRYNEGVTEYFTERVLGAPGRAYRGELELAKGLIWAAGAGPMHSAGPFRIPKVSGFLISALGERDVGAAYFRDPAYLYYRVRQALGRANTFDAWWHKSRSKIPGDMKDANQLLVAALTQPVSGSGGSSTTAGSGSRS
ncbi:MAG TPA: hypothetical protein VGG77_02430 [Roseiarcus sp.]|jgi:hypothetical protein